MERLCASDLALLVDVMSTVVRLETIDEYRHGVVRELHRLVAGEAHGYNEIEPGGPPAYMVIDPPDADVDGADEAVTRLAFQNPLIAAGASGDGRALKWSDFVTRRELHGTDLYDLVYRRQGTEAQLACALPATPSRVIGLVVNRGRRDFSERDRAMLDLARPAFVQAYRAAVERELVRALLEGTESADVILLSPHGTVVRATPRAERWLDDHGRDRADRLPVGVLGWVEERREAGRAGRRTLGDAPLRLVPAGAGGLDALVIEWPAPRVRPEVRKAFGLTRREFEVLEHVGAGRTNAQIALDLGIREDTVAKHLHHVYGKLGVSSRTEALSRAAFPES